MTLSNATGDVELTHTERPFEDTDLEGLSKTALQNFVKAHREKWPTAVHGKFTEKTNMRTMRAVLLDQALGFTIRVPSTLVSEVMARVEGHLDQRSDDRSSTLLGSNAIAINNLFQTLDTDDRVPGNVGNGSDLDTSVNFRTLVHDSPQSQQLPTYGIDYGQTNPAPYAPEAFDFAGLKTTNFETEAPSASFPLPDVPATPTADMSVDMHSPLVSSNADVFENSSACGHGSELGYSEMGPFSNAGEASAKQQGWPTAVSEKPFKKTRGPARQASFARAKNDPVKKAAKQQKTNQTVEWLVAELQNRAGYTDFRNTFNQIKHNPDAVRSWTFAIDFMKSCNGLMLVNGSYKKIKKVEIRTALGVGSAWLFEAKRAVDILQKYGEGGTHPNQLVIDKVALADGEAEGSTKLLSWLKAWEMAHPV